MPHGTLDRVPTLWQGTATRRKAADIRQEGIIMPKEEWGTKRLCPETGKRFYDLNKDPIVSPYTGNVVTIDTSKTRTMVADAEDAQSKKMKDTEEDDDLVLEEDDDDEDVDLGDDVLEDDDEDTVSLDEIADVSKSDDD